MRKNLQLGLGRRWEGHFQAEGTAGEKSRGIKPGEGFKNYSSSLRREQKF